MNPQRSGAVPPKGPLLSIGILAASFLAVAGPDRQAAAPPRERPASQAESPLDPARLPKQFLLFDTIAVHTEDGQMMTLGGYGWNPTFTRSQEVPPDWTQPIDFAGGGYRIRYEVLEKPNRRTIHFCIVLKAEPRKPNLDLPSHPGSRKFTEPGFHLEEGIFSRGFARTYQKQGGWSTWNWKKPFSFVWEDSYRQGSSQYGPSSVFPAKVRTEMTVIAKGFQYHPFGNVGGLDFRNLRAFPEAAAFLERGRLGEAMIWADRVRRESDPRRAEEARWVLECLLRHAETRLKEVQELARQEPDIALEDLKPLAEQFKGTAIGQRLAAEAAALEASEAMARCRRARGIWKKVLAESNQIEVPNGIGHERHDHFVPMPEDLQKKYARELAAIKDGVAEMLSVYNACFNWKRMAQSLLYNLGIEKKR